MCQTVIATDGRWLRTIEDLEAESIPVPSHCRDGDWSPDWCLCGVDVIAALDKSGRRYRDVDIGFELLS